MEDFEVEEEPIDESTFEFTTEELELIKQGIHTSYIISWYNSNSDNPKFPKDKIPRNPNKESCLTAKGTLRQIFWEYCLENFNLSQLEQTRETLTILTDKQKDQLREKIKEVKLAMEIIKDAQDKVPLGNIEKDSITEYIEYNQRLIKENTELKEQLRSRGNSVDVSMYKAQANERLEQLKWLYEHMNHLSYVDGEEIEARLRMSKDDTIELEALLVLTKEFRYIPTEDDIKLLEQIDEVVRNG